MKATKLKSGNWNVRVYIGEVDGKKKWKSFTAKTKSEALRKAAAVEVGSYDDLSLVEACQRYIDDRQYHHAHATELDPTDECLPEVEEEPSRLRPDCPEIFRDRQDLPGADRSDRAEGDVHPHRRRGEQSHGRRGSRAAESHRTGLPGHETRGDLRTGRGRHRPAAAHRQSLQGIREGTGRRFRP